MGTDSFADEMMQGFNHLNIPDLLAAREQYHVFLTRHPNVVATAIGRYLIRKPGVAKDSYMATYAALRLDIDSWRWHGVPFYVRAGKSLKMTVTEVTATPRGKIEGSTWPPL